MVFACAVAIPIEIVVAVKQTSIWDRVLSFIAFFGMSVPNFFLAFLMMYLALRTGWFPVGATFSPYYESLDTWGRIADRINHLILPVFVLGLAGEPAPMCLLRWRILQIDNSEFVPN